MAASLDSALVRFREELAEDQVAKFNERVNDGKISSIAAFIQELDVSKTGVPRRCLGSRISPWLEKLQMMLGLGAPLADLDPNRIAAPVLGAVQMVLKLAIQFAKFYERLTEMLMKWGIKMSLLVINKSIYTYNPELQRRVLDLEVLFVDFCTTCLKSMNLSAKHNWTVNHLRSAADRLFNGFDGTYGPIEIKFNESVDTLKLHIDAAYAQASFIHRQRSEAERRQQSAFRPLMLREAEKGMEMTKDVREQVAIAEAMKQRERDEALLRQLSSYPYQDSFKQNRKTTIDTAGQWVVGRKEYRDWLNSQNGTLLLTGNLGTGKSVLCAKILSDIQGRQRIERLLYFFATPSNPSSLRARHILGSLARQYLGSLPLSPDVRARLALLFEGHQTVGSSQIGLFLRQIMFEQSKQDATLVVDGLDQMQLCEINALMTELSQLWDGKIRAVKLLLISREESERTIRSALGKKTTISQIHTVAKEVQKDIQDYVQYFVNENLATHDLCSLAPDLPALIEKTITSKAEGFFLLAVLQLEELRTLRTPAEQRRMLPLLPRSLSEMFVFILRKIKDAGDAEIVSKIMKIVSAAQRPLSLLELRDAIAIQEGQKWYDREALVMDPYSLIPTCRSLIIWDKDDDQVRFAHESVRECLCSSTSPLPDELSLFKIDQLDACAEMGVIVVTYLSFSNFETQLTSTAGTASAVHDQAISKIAATIPVETIKSALGPGKRTRLVAKLLKVNSSAKSSFTPLRPATSKAPEDISDRPTDVEFPLLQYCLDSFLPDTQFLTLSKKVRQLGQRPDANRTWQAFARLWTKRSLDLDAVQKLISEIQHLSLFQLVMCQVSLRDERIKYDSLVELFHHSPEAMERALPIIKDDLTPHHDNLLYLLVHASIPRLTNTRSDSSNDWGLKCLIAAIRITSVRSLDGRVIDPNDIHDPHGRQPIIVAVTFSSLQAISLLLVDDGSPHLESRDAQDRSIPEIFAARAYTEALQWWTTFNHVIESSRLLRCIHLAAMHYSVDTLSVLLDLYQAIEPLPQLSLSDCISVIGWTTVRSIAEPVLAKGASAEMTTLSKLLLTRETPLAPDHRLEQLATVQYLLPWCGDFNLSNEWGETPLHFAAQTGNTELVKLLVQTSRNKSSFEAFWDFLNHMNHNGMTALGLAVDSIYAEPELIAFLMIECFASTDVATQGTVNVLQLALRRAIRERDMASDRMFEAVFNAGRSLSFAILPTGDTVMHQVIVENLVLPLRKMRESEIWPKELRFGQESCVAYAAGNHTVSPETLAVLLETGANPDAVMNESRVRFTFDKVHIHEDRDTDSSGGVSLLRKTIKTEQSEKLACLLKHGATVNEVPERSPTTLQYAIICTDEQKALVMTDLLLKHGANLRTSEGENILIGAIMTGRERVVERLCEAGASLAGPPLTDGDYSESLLDHLALVEHIEVLRVLIHHKAIDVNQYVDRQQLIDLQPYIHPDLRILNARTTILQIAARKRSPEVIHLLLRSGANPDAGPRGGRALDDLARSTVDKRERDRSIMCLLFHGATVDESTEDGAGGNSSTRRVISQVEKRMAVTYDVSGTITRFPYRRVGPGDSRHHWVPSATSTHIWHYLSDLQSLISTEARSKIMHRWEEGKATPVLFEELLRLADSGVDVDAHLRTIYSDLSWEQRLQNQRYIG